LGISLEMPKNCTEFSLDLMRAVIGAVLGFATMLLGVLIPILMIAGISGIIFGCRVFHGPQPKTDPATTFAIVSIIIGINIGVWTAFCLLSLSQSSRISVCVSYESVKSSQTEPLLWLAP
jgi:hypothetical protein